MPKFPFLRLVSSAALTLLLAVQPVYAVESTALIESAETSFKYIANTLYTFHSTGRLVNNPGIDGSDLEHFILLLEDFYRQFSSGFDRDSAMCQFYMDPENGRMTIEDKAEISFGFLRDLDDRLDRYISVDGEFKDSVEEQFGSILLTNIMQAKQGAISNQRLPSSDFDEAARINFADTSCG